MSDIDRLLTVRTRPAPTRYEYRVMGDAIKPPMPWDERPYTSYKQALGVLREVVEDARADYEADIAAFPDEDAEIEVETFWIERRAVGDWERMGTQASVVSAKEEET